VAPIVTDILIPDDISSRLILSSSIQALDLDSTRNDRLSPVIEELNDLKAVWTALSGVWAQIADIREMSWSTIQVRSRL
jgi:hypothetical protein